MQRVTHCGLCIFPFGSLWIGPSSCGYWIWSNSWKGTLLLWTSFPTRYLLGWLLPFLQISVQVHLLSPLTIILFVVNWSIVDLQCSVTFTCTTKWFSYTRAFQILFPIAYTRQWVEFHVLYSRSLRSVQFSHTVVSDSLRPMDCSTLGLPVHHQLPESTQTHVHWVGGAI